MVGGGQNFEYRPVEIGVRRGLVGRNKTRTHEVASWCDTRRYGNRTGQSTVRNANDSKKDDPVKGKRLMATRAEHVHCSNMKLTGVKRCAFFALSHARRGSGIEPQTIAIPNRTPPNRKTDWSDE
ncbi:hypothetical protein QTP88_003720 [Uroleucon formosanum]